MRMPRITTRRLMILVALAALILWPVHCIRQGPHYLRQSGLHALLAGLCEYEAGRMRHRADACAARARRGAPWDDPSEQAADLKCGPYPSAPGRGRVLRTDPDGPRQIPRAILSLSYRTTVVEFERQRLYSQRRAPDT